MLYPSKISSAYVPKPDKGFGIESALSDIISYLYKLILGNNK